METFKIIFNSWQFNLGMDLFFSVLFIQYYKLAVVNSQKEGASTIILQTIAGISVLFLAPFFLFKFPNNFFTYFLLVTATIFYALNDRIQTTVRKNLDVSVYTILNKLCNVFIIVYGIVLFKEDIKVLQLLGGFLIVFGNIILFYQKRKIKLNKNILLGILAPFILATALIIDVDISKNFNLPVYIAITFIFPAILIYFFGKHSVKEIKEEFFSSDKKYYLITGISWGLLMFFEIRSLQSMNVSLMSPLLATSVLLNVIVASVLHNEKEDLVKKIVAAMLVILGVSIIVH